MTNVCQHASQDGDAAGANDQDRLEEDEESSRYTKDLIGRDIFVHKSYLPEGVAKLAVKQEVELQISYSKKGLQATRVQIASPPATTNEETS